MKIALSGYGKMGKTIQALIENDPAYAQHEIVLIGNSENPLSVEALRNSNAETVIDFSTPDSAFENIKTCINAGVPVASGTTAWLEKYEDAVALCKEKSSAFLYASNFSIGVNLFFALNSHLAKLMDGQAYQAHLEETHHTTKLDAPSGTAISLANDLITHHEAYAQWVNPDVTVETKEGDLTIKSHRRDDVKGTHRITYSSAVDSIYIEHEAHSREGFARGAILAAIWLADKKGVYSMKDVLEL